MGSVATLVLPRHVEAQTEDGGEADAHACKDGGVRGLATICQHSFFLLSLGSSSTYLVIWSLLSFENHRPTDVSGAVSYEQDSCHGGLLGVPGEIARDDAQAEREPARKDTGQPDPHQSSYFVGAWELTHEQDAHQGDHEHERHGVATHPSVFIGDVRRDEK